MTTYILVASNNQTNLKLVREAVAKQDVEVVNAPSVSLALFLAQKNLPSLILSDLEFSDGDGILFLQEIRANKQLNSTPFIFLLQTLPSQSLRQTLLTAGATAIISNSIQPEVLLCDFNRLILPNYAKTQDSEDETTE